mmetsp:Transcript_999/g.2133  ORF Transcript_999/g.2133 Transcript_999/m.2133 type:complete len:420 (-) Transcript_999:382-1641(-)
MATLRHGEPVQLSGWVQQEKRWMKQRSRKYLRLRGTILSVHQAQGEPAAWEISVLDHPIKSGPRLRELTVSVDAKKISFFAESDADFKSWTDAIRKATSRSISDFYKMGKVLGEGGFAQVMEGWDRDSAERFAIKVIKKREYNPYEMEFVLREMNIMKSINHPNIVRTYDIFDNDHTLHIVMEYMGGGELFDIIAAEGHLSERRASSVASGLIEGVSYLHEHGIVHRDIKPENILCGSRDWPLRVKISDFGLAKFIDENEIQEERKRGVSALIGTPSYVAPEVIQMEEYGPPVDMWACGVILYIMISGKMPFFGRDEHQCLTRIASGQYAFPNREWKNVSEECKSLIRSLLQVDPQKRLTAKAALKHKWMDSESLRDDSIENDLSGIHSCRRKFKKAVNAALTIQRMRDIVARLTAAAS